MFSCRQSDKHHQYVQTINAQKSQVLFLAEETDREERQGEDQQQRILSVEGSVVAAPHFHVGQAPVPDAGPLTEEHFDIHPPLFTLHCLLRI
jgi:hypothetical protein